MSNMPKQQPNISFQNKDKIDIDHGWLQRQICAVQKDVQQLPVWLKGEGISDMTMPAQTPSTSFQNYVTPPTLIKAVKTLLNINSFAFDFAASAENTKSNHFWTAEQDSLSFTPTAWAEVCHSGWGWLNPPFKHLKPWAQACEQAYIQGAKIALLVPASVGANWYRDHVYPHTLTLALNGRVPFIPNKPTWLYPKDLMLCLYGMPIGTLPDFRIWDWKQNVLY